MGRSVRHIGTNFHWYRNDQFVNNQPNPVNVTSVSYDLTEMVITWGESSDNDFVSYELLQSDSEDGTYTSVTVINDQSTTSHSLTEYDPTHENWF